MKNILRLNQKDDSNPQNFANYFQQLFLPGW